MRLAKEYYKNTLLGLHRGNGRGVVSNAKPLFCISILDCIANIIVSENKFVLTNDAFVTTYNTLCDRYEPDKQRTPIYKPYFHLNSEPFYNLIWKKGTNIPGFSTTPSAKFLRENVQYASLDKELWKLLQDAAVRNEFREAIVNHFLKSKN